MCNKLEGYIELTHEIISTLLHHKKRTGIGSWQLLKGRAPEKPKGLTAQTVDRWLSKQVKTTRKDYLDYVMAKWEKYPDLNDAFVKLTDKKRKLLEQKFKQTGLSPNKLFAGRSDLPKGFNWKSMSQHAYPSSTVQTIRKEHYDYLLRVYEENKGLGYIEITQGMRSTIQDEINRTGVSIAQVTRIYGDQHSPVKAPVVCLWLNGKVKKAERRSFDYILKLYASIPDKVIEPKTEPLKQERKPAQYTTLRFESLEIIPTSSLKKLQYYRKKHRLLPSKIFKLTQEPPPAGLDSYIVKSWLYGGSKRADPEHLKWILQRCQEYEKFNLKNGRSPSSV